MSIPCVFGCLTLCGLRDRVTQQLVFFPPKPPIYVVKEEKDERVMCIRTPRGGNLLRPLACSSTFMFEMVETAAGQKIATMHIAYPGATTTILFSHGNATDLGGIRAHLRDFSIRLQVNVFAYDYSGYGLSTGKPCVSNLYTDAEAAYMRLVTNYSPKLLILYGQSLGSAPSLFLAKHHQVDGVVIHSGLLSAMRVLRPESPRLWFDILTNIDMVKDCHAPLFVIHGTDDVEVPIQHGIELSEQAPMCAEPWFVQNGEHNNIEMQFRSLYFRKIAEFLVTAVAQSKQRKSKSKSQSKSQSKSKSKSKSRQGSTDAKQLQQSPPHPVFTNVALDPPSSAERERERDADLSHLTHANPLHEATGSDRKPLLGAGDC